MNTQLAVRDAKACDATGEVCDIVVDNIEGKLLSNIVDAIMPPTESLSAMFRNSNRTSGMFYSAIRHEQD